MDRILLVDDSPGMHRLVGLVADRLGLSLEHAYDGAQALKLVALESFSVVVLDLYMPTLDGMSFLRLLPERTAADRPAVLVISSSGEDEDVRRAFGFGAAAFLQKPFSAQLLGETIGRLVGRATATGT